MRIGQAGNPVTLKEAYLDLENTLIGEGAGVQAERAALGDLQTDLVDFSLKRTRQCVSYDPGPLTWLDSSDVRLIHFRDGIHLARLGQLHHPLSPTLSPVWA